MPILKLQPKATKKPITIKVSGLVIDDLRLYAKFVNASINEVAQEAFSYVFSRDAEFKEWREQQATPPPEPAVLVQAEPTQTGKSAAKQLTPATKPAPQIAPIQ